MESRGYIVVQGEGTDKDYFYIRLLPNIAYPDKFIQLAAIYLSEEDAENDADRIMAFVFGEEVD